MEEVTLSSALCLIRKNDVAFLFVRNTAGKPKT